MNPHELEVFNSNVDINNHNVELLENNTISNRNSIDFVFEYVQEADFWWMIMVLILLLYMFLINLRLNNMEQRIDELEETEDYRPELEPLIAKATKV